MKRAFLSLAIALLGTAMMCSQSGSETAIRGVIDKQTQAWNRGDIPSFMQTYEDSPETTFVGDKVEHGYAQILERYKRVYGTPALMGKLTFSNMAIRVLDAKYAAVTGNFHLDRTAAAGGNADGIFSLLLRKGPVGWKIILDHSNRTH
jgi:uncharacterized protein (TIGR02246 family)